MWLAGSGPPYRNGWLVHSSLVKEDVMDVSGGSMSNLSSGQSELMGINNQGLQMEGAQNAQAVEQIMQQAMLTVIRTFAEMIGKTAKAMVDSMKGLV
jgi:hypothetical protein